jgi:thiol-disulfide isomerase/thioredoxin
MVMRSSSLLLRSFLCAASASPKLTWSGSALSFPFSSTAPRAVSNRVFSPVLTPPTFHDYLRLVSANNTLLLALFTTSACAPCRTIIPLLTELVNNRAPAPEDRFSALALAEVELDSPDTTNGNMMDLGVEWGISSIPTLIGFGGRRADRITDRLYDVKTMSDKADIRDWIDNAMSKGDPFQ